jgi:carbon storage regulator
MLVLTRKPQQQIQIGNNITVTVVRVQGSSVRLGIEAPDNVRIIRSELAAVMAEFRDDEPTDDEGELTSSDLDVSAHEPSEALRSTDEEDETRTLGRGVATGAKSLPMGRAPGDRCQLRRPPRLGPAAFRSMSCR